MPVAIVPSSGAPIAGPGGRVTTEWQRFFNAIVGKPAAIAAVTLTGSPFAYLAGAPGTLSVSGGTVSAISITRTGATAPTGVTAGLVPMSSGDTVTITYAVAPTVSFVPN